MQQKHTEVERTTKWLKMLRSWDKYKNSEKVSRSSLETAAAAWSCDSETLSHVSSLAEHDSSRFLNQHFSQNVASFFFPESSTSHDFKPVLNCVSTPELWNKPFL